MEDTKIVELYWQRSEDAIPETAAKFGPYCHTIAYNILSDTQDTEECVNDTWLGAWNSMPTNRPKVLAPYLAKLTRWFSLTRLREQNALRRGGGDTTFVSIGAGSTRPGDTHIYVGTSGWVSNCLDHQTADISATITGVLSAKHIQHTAKSSCVPSKMNSRCRFKI